MPTDSINLYREHKVEFKYRQVSVPVITVLLSDARGRGGFLNLSVCPFFLLWDSIVE